MISCHWVLWSRRSGTSRVLLQKCANLVIARTYKAHARHAILQPEYSCCYHRVCFRCLVVKSIWYWMKPYLVVKISSDIVTEHCCQVCILSMMFCHSVAVCWHGKWLRNQQETPRSTHVDLNCGRPTWDIKNIIYISILIFTFCVDRDTSVLELFYVVSQQKRFAMLTRQSKTVSKIVGLRWTRKTQNDAHVDTYCRKPELISWW